MGCVDEHLLCTVFHGEGLHAERPAGADKEVALHAQPLGFAEGGTQSLNPLVAQPDEGGDAEAVAPLGGELDGVDFHAAYACFVQQEQFALQFDGVHLVAVPPPADKGLVGRDLAGGDIGHTECLLGKRGVAQQHKEGQEYGKAMVFHDGRLWS